MTRNLSAMNGSVARWAASCACLLAGLMLGCKPPPPGAKVQAVPQAAEPSGAPAAEKTAPEAAATVDGLPAKLVENVEQLIKLTAEYNARAEKITDRQTYLAQSGSLAELENELSNYVQYVEAIAPTLTSAQQATLDSKHFSRAKPLIDAKRQHKERMLALP